MKRVAIAVAAILLLAGGALAALSATAGKPDDLGPVEGRLRGCPGPPNCVSSQAGSEGRRIAPFEFSGSGDTAMERLRSVLASRPRTRIVEERPGYIRAEATTLVFRFVDDLEFLLDGQARVIHVRSASRVGYSDLGANRTRMESVRAAFRAAGN